MNSFSFNNFSLKPSGTRVWIASFYLLFLGICFAGYFPGGLCGDTIADIHAALRDVVGLNDPPLLQISIRWLQKITISQWPLLLIQLGLYFFGFFLISMYFLNKGRQIFAWLALLLSVFPHLLYMHTLVVKDVLVGGLWLNVMGLALLSGTDTNRYRVIVCRGVAGLMILLSILCRDNTFLAAPALLMMLIPPEWAKRWLGTASLSKSATIFLITVFACYGFMRAINSQLIPGSSNRDYRNDFFVRQICTVDLIGMSVMKNHDGVTAHLGNREKKYLEDLYYKRPVFWLKKDLFQKIFPSDEIILRQWKEEVLNHPLEYLQHRSNLFAGLFVGNPGLQMMWVGQSRDLQWVQERLDVDETTARKFVVSDYWENNPVYAFSRYVFRSYFEGISDWILVLQITFCSIIFFWLVLKMKCNRVVHPSEWIVFHAILAGLFYVIPNFFFVQHSETRYVYPTLILFFVSSLVFVEIGISRNKKCGSFSLKSLFSW